MKNVWEVSIVPKLKIGARMESRNGAQYELISFDDSGFIIQRPETKSTVKITKRQVLKTFQRLEQGEHLQFQKIQARVGLATPSQKRLVSYGLSVTLFVQSPMDMWLEMLLRNPNQKIIYGFPM